MHHKQIVHAWGDCGVRPCTTDATFQATFDIDLATPAVYHDPNVRYFVTSNGRVGMRYLNAYNWQRPALY